MQEIKIRTDSSSPRLAYICDFLSERYSNILLSVESNSMPELNEYTIIYQIKKPVDKAGFWIPSSGGIQINNYLHPAGFDSFQNMPVLFRSIEANGFDFFYAIFWLLSRMEEYRANPTDAHQRFSSHSSLLFQSNLLKIPMIDVWLDWFDQQIFQHFGIKAERKIQTPSLTIGVDIDFFWKYHYKSWWKLAGAGMLELITFQWKQLAERISVIMNQIKDPYDSYDEIEKLSNPFVKIMFFVLAGGDSANDNNQSVDIPDAKQLLKKLSLKHPIGLHPSYSSFLNADQLETEKNKLENAIDQRISSSRFHFLRMKLPESYVQLERNQITDDYSLGFAEQSGFKAGTVHSFLWYNLSEEKVTSLRIHPFVAMDRGYKDYLKYNSAEALNDMLHFYKICRRYGGDCHVIWHNSSFGRSGEWKEYHGFLQKLIASILKENEQE
ncbi:MAG: hypothetical protein IPM48_06375 [Saprospiraceae bacterium]|nr:hypothetical protein [Saprospiraceae bacterium]